MEDEIKSSGINWPLLIRIILLIYLISLPACVTDAGHFGPGFFPLMIAIFLVPLFSIGTLIDCFSVLLGMGSQGGLRQRWPTVVLSTLLCLGYGAIVGVAIMERAGS